MWSKQTPQVTVKDGNDGSANVKTCPEENMRYG